MTLYNMVAGPLSYFNDLCILSYLLAEDSSTGLHTFLIRSQMAMHCGGYAFDLEMQTNMFLRDFGWYIHGMTLLKVIKKAAKIKWIKCFKVRFFPIRFYRGTLICEDPKRFCLPERFCLLCVSDVIHAEDCESKQHQCMNKATWSVSHCDKLVPSFHWSWDRTHLVSRREAHMQNSPIISIRLWFLCPWWYPRLAISSPETRIRIEIVYLEGGSRKLWTGNDE